MTARERKEIEAKIKAIKGAQFTLMMKDRWTAGDYARDREYDYLIKEYEKMLDNEE